jgi:hypothetical protein
MLASARWMGKVGKVTIPPTTLLALVALVLAVGVLSGCATALPTPNAGPGSLRMYRLPLLDRPPALFTPPVRADVVEDLEYAPASLDSADRRLAQLDGRAVAATASSLVGTRAGRDCFGFVVEVYRRNGVDLREDGGEPGDNGVRILWRFADRRGALHRRGAPAVGDLVFFDDTYDRNRDGRRNDPLTHVGIVEKVEGDRIWFVHRVGRGVVRSVMSLDEPTVRSRDGEPLNDYIRLGRRSHGDRLAGALFAGFAKLVGG